jgi:hypothetical protein
MRAADDFRVIRLRLEELERERQWAAHKRERELRDDELDRMHFQAVQQRIKDEWKARFIARNRLG